MDADEALARWGSKQLKIPYVKGNVQVEFEMDPGYACCGGANPDCYCSFAESPYNYIEIVSKSPKRRERREGIELRDILQELLEIAGTN